MFDRMMDMESKPGSFTSFFRWVSVLLVVLASCGLLGCFDSTEASFLRLNTEDGRTQQFDASGHTDEVPIALKTNSVDNEVVKAVVTRTLYLGGGLSRVCVERPGTPRTYCVTGLADVKVGDTVYYRFGRMTLWYVDDVFGSDTYSEYIITEMEAKALLATGEFVLLE